MTEIPEIPDTELPHLCHAERRIFRPESIELLRTTPITRDIFAEGQKAGATKIAKKIALNFLRDGLSIEVIARCTDLPLETVQHLQEQLTATPPNRARN